MRLSQFANTEQQRLIAELSESGLSKSSVAKQVGCNERTVRRTLDLIKSRAAIKGYSPEHDMTKPVPDSFVVKGVSSYYNQDGELAGQWVKSSIDMETKRQMMEAAIAALAEDIKPAKKVKPPAKQASTQLVNTYILTDYHIGMLAWGEETGADWDIDLAEDTLIKWFKKSIELAPQADACVFAQLGDFMHFDSYTPVTVASGHILDSDSRLQKIIRCVIRVTREIISMLLSKYKLVHVKWCDANHDPTSAAWMREFLSAFYEKEPRIYIDNSPDSYYCFEWGDTSLFFHHGHKRRVANVDSVFAAKFREVFGRTKNAYAHMGHYHSIDKKETNLMVVEQHRTLAAPDAYASKAGFMSGRDSSVITYHKRYGEVGRNVVSYRMVQDV